LGGARYRSASTTTGIPSLCSSLPTTSTRSMAAPTFGLPHQRCTRAITRPDSSWGCFQDVKENRSGDDVREGHLAVVRERSQPALKADQGKLNSDIAGTVGRLSSMNAGMYSSSRILPLPEIIHKLSNRPSPERPEKHANLTRRIRRAGGGGLPASWPTAANAARPPRAVLVEGESAVHRQAGRDRNS